jgi:hypothetical protein
VTQVAICGGDELRAACEILGLEPASGVPRLVLVDLRWPGAALDASAIAAEIPRIVVATEEQAASLAALGAGRIRVASSADPAILGPLVARSLPTPVRERTRIVTLTAARGGTGRTMCAAALARRLAADRTVMAIDATGTGALGWWLGAMPRSWSELEALVGELRDDHVELVATAIAPRLSLVGGPPTSPSGAVLESTIAAARSLADVVLVDAPLLSDERVRLAVARSDRVLVFSYGDPASRAALAESDVPEGAWLVGSQAPVDGAFRVLPRDEGAVAAALAGRGPIGGALGRAYDELSELLAIDAS